MVSNRSNTPGTKLRKMMTAHSKYLASLLNVFSTFLESHSVSKDLTLLTTEFFVVFISNKKNYHNWPMGELKKFIEAENVPTKPALLLKKFLKEYTPHEVDVFLHEFLTSLKLDNKSDSTIKNYRSDIQQLVEHSQKLELKKLFKPEVIRDFINSQLQSGLKKSTIKRKIVSITQFALWAESENIVQDVSFWISDIDQVLEKKHNHHKKPTTKPEAPSEKQEKTTQKEPQKTSSITPQQALDKYLVSLEIDQHSPATIKNYKSDISQFIDQAKTENLPDLLSEKTITKFVTQQKREGLKLSTIKRKVSSITQFALWAESKNLVASVSNWIDSIQHTVSSFEPKSAKTQSPTQQTQKNTPFQLKLKDHGLVKAHDKTNKHSTWTLPTPGFTKNHNTSQTKSAKSESKNAAANNKTESAEVFAGIRTNLQEFANQINTKRNRILLPYINLALLLIFVIGLGYLAYQQFILQAPAPLAYPSTPVRPNRELSFQGRLTDTAQNPITSSTDMAFRLYDNNTGGTQLWSSGTCSVTPDQDGIFNVGLGDDCGSEITEDVFSENSNVWLEVEVDSETLTPRQSIKTVPYALNSETVQGYPVDATGAATVNTILTMDSAGQVVLGEVSPTLKATSGTFAIEAQTLSLQTSSGSNGNILLSPDGTGKVIVQSDLDLEGYLHAPGATFSATYAGGTALIAQAGPTGTANIQEWRDSAGTTLSVVDENGNVGIGTSNPNTAFELVGGDNRVVNGRYYLREDDNGGFAVMLDADNDGGQINVYEGGTVNSLINGSGVSYFNGGNVGIRTTSPNASLEVKGTSTTWGGQALSLQSSANTNSWDFLVNSSDNLYFGYNESTAAYLDTSGNFDIIGNLEAGTTAGDASITAVFGSANNGYLNLYESSNLYGGVVWYDGSAAQLNIGTRDNSSTPTNAIQIDRGSTTTNLLGNAIVSGNVGIGSTSPGYELDLVGELNLTDAIRVAGDAGANGFVLTSSAGGANTWTDPSTLGLSYWANTNNVFHPKNEFASIVDLVIGGTSTASADIQLFSDGTAVFNEQGNDADFRVEGVGQANALFVQGSDGNVGIGTNAPSALFSVSGNSVLGAVRPVFIGDGDDVGTEKLQIVTDDSTDTDIDAASVRIYDADSFLRVSGDNTDRGGEIKLYGRSHATYPGGMLLSTGNAATMYLSENNEVGIGTTDPNGLLNVIGASTGQALVQLQETGDQDILTASNSAGTTRFRMANNGYLYAERFADISNDNYFLDPAAAGTSLAVASNVGIGSTSPNYKLDLVGEFNLTDAIRVAGDAGTTGFLLTSSGGGANTWTDPSSITGAGYWNETDGVFHPKSPYTDVIDLTLGGNTTASADIHLYSDGSATFNEQGNDADFRVETSGQANAFFVQGSDGNVGIGTNTPDWKLKVTGTTGNVGMGSDSGYQMHIDAATLNHSTLQMSTISGYDPRIFLDASNNDNDMWIVNNTSASRFHIGPSSEHGDAWINIYTAGAAKAGYVGINTNDPDAFLDVNGTASISGVLTLNSVSAGGDDSVLILDDNGQVRQDEIDSRVWGTSLVDGSGTTNRVAYWTDADTIAADDNFFFDGTNVGIGTTVPVGLLNVKGARTGQALVQLQETGDQDILTASNSAGTTRFRVANNGYIYGERFADVSNSNYFLDPAAAGIGLTVASNVGIGSTSPNYKLDVIGEANFTDAIRVNGDAGTSGFVFTSSGGGANNWTDPYDLITAGWLTNTLNVLHAKDEYAEVVDLVIGGTSTASADIQLYSDGSAVFNEQGNDADFRVEASGQANALFVQGSDGNVGIGTGTPIAELDVTGRVKLDNGSNTAPTLTFDANDTAGFYASTGGSGFVVYASGNQDRYWFGPNYLQSSNSDAFALRRAAGSATVPTYTFYNDEDTGLARAATNELTLVTGGFERIRVDSSGNVGIGSTTPIALLDIAGTASVSGALTLDGVSAGGDNTVLILDDNNQVRQDEIDSRVWGTSLVDGSGTANRVAYWTDGDTIAADDDFFFDGTNIGIGTTAPTGKLNIEGAATGKALTIINETGDQSIFEASASGTSVFTIANNGNVGIGSTAPAYKLDVNGTGRFTGAVDFDGDIELNSTLTDINGSVGTNGQVLTSTTTGVDWVDPSTFGFQSWEVADDDGDIYSIVDSNILRFTSSDSNVLTNLINGDDGDENLDFSIRLLGDAVAGDGLSGGADDVLVGADTDVTFSINAGDGIALVTDNVTVNEAYNFAWTGTQSWSNSADFNGDVSIADTSVLFDGANTNFATTGDFSINTNQLYIDQTSGNVGIGTTSPSYELDLVGEFNLTDAIRVNGDAGTSAYLLTSSAGGANTWTDPYDLITAGWLTNTLNVLHAKDEYAEVVDLVIGGTSTASADIQLYSDGSAVFNEQGNDADFRVEASGQANALFVQGSDGNVGIGTSSPQRLFETQSATGTNNYIRFDTTDADTATSAIHLEFAEAGTVKWDLKTIGNNADRLVLDSGSTSNILVVNQDGNIGIGSTAPAYELDVVGELNLTDAIRVNGDAGTSGYLLTSSAGGANTWTDPDDITGAGWWENTDNVLHPKAEYGNVVDLTLGGTATASANIHLQSNGDGYFAGNIGIGTSTLSQKLRVISDDDVSSTEIVSFLANNETAGIGIRYGEITSIGSNTNNALKINAKGSGTLTLQDTATGSVIVGASTADNYKFEVSGNQAIQTEGTNYSRISLKTTNNNFFLQTDDTVGDWFGIYDGVNSQWRLNILTDGNVGIGTTAPEGLLNVDGAATGRALTILNETGDQDIFAASASGTTRFVIANNGNVGINSTTPANKLDVVGNIGLGVYPGGEIVHNGDTDTKFQFGNNTVRLQAGGTPGVELTTTQFTGNWANQTDMDFSWDGDTNDGVLFVDSSTENVGIGTTAPAYKLDVVGELNLTDAIRVAGDAGTSGYLLTSSGGGANSWTDPDTINNAGWWDNTLNVLHAKGDYGDVVDVSVGGTSTASADIYLSANGSAVFNEQANDSDFRVEGVGQTNALFVQGSDGNVGISTNAPATLFDINSLFNVTSAGNVGIGSTTPATLFDVNNLFNVTSAGNVGIGTNTPGSALEVQGGTTGPALTLHSNDTGYSASIFEVYNNSSTLLFRIEDDEGISIPQTAGHVIGSTSTNKNRQLTLTGTLNAVNNDAAALLINSSIVADDNSGTAHGLSIDLGGFTTDTTSSPSLISSLFVDSTTISNGGGGVPTTGASVYIDGAISGATNNYALYVNGASDKSYFAGNVGIGTTAPLGLLSVEGAATGKALATLNETGDQDIFTASASGNTRLRLTSGGDILPGTDDSQVLGSSTLRWQDLYLGPASLHIGTDGNDATISYDTTSNYLGFDPDGDATNEVVFQDDGNVGIGSISPNYKLDVVGEANFTDAIRLNTDAGTSGYLLTSSGGGLNTWTDPDTINGSGWWDNTLNVLHGKNSYGDIVDVAIGGTSTASADIYLSANGSAVFNEQGNDADFRVETSGQANALFVQGSDGNVGLGTASPDSRVHVYGSGQQYINIESTGSSSFMSGLRATNDLSNYTIAGQNGSAAFSYGAIGAGDGFLYTFGDDLAISADAPTAAIKFGTGNGGTEKMRLTSTGNLGINTTSPGARLDIRNSASEDILNLYDVATEVFTVIDGGNVGIGTNNPGGKLSIQNTAATEILFGGSASANIYQSQSAQALYIGTNTGNLYLGTSGSGSQQITIDSSGNVGIGSTSPGYTLDVAGELNLTDAVRANGDAGTTGYLLTSSGGGGMTWTDPSTLSASTFWDETLNVLHPANSYGEVVDLTIGGTSTASADIQLFSDGSAVFNEQGNDADFRVETTADTNTFFIEGSTGNIGLGTTNPNNRIHVYGSSAEYINVESTGTTQGAGLRATNDVSDYSVLGQYGSTAGAYGVITPGVGYVYTFGDDLAIAADGASSNIKFGTGSGSNEKMRLTSAGNLGIGTTSPDNLLELSSTTDPQLKITHTPGTDETTIGVDANGLLGIIPNGGAYLYADPGQANRSILAANRTINSTGSVYGYNFDLHKTGSGGAFGILAFVYGDANGGSIEGSYVAPAITGAYTVDNLRGYRANLSSNTGASITGNVDGFIADLNGDLGSVTGDVKFFHADNDITAGTIPNLYGFYVDALTQGTNNYAVYTAGTTKSYFGGNVGIGSTAPESKLDVVGRITGGFGAMSTGGTTDWNDASNSRSGNGYTLLQGTATNGPSAAGGNYFHPFNFEYSSKDGSGNTTQLAVPYATTGSIDQGIYMRGRYSAAWSNWVRIISEDTNGNVGIGNTTPDSFKLEVTGNLGPSADATYNLGSSAKQWQNIYANGIVTATGLFDSDVDTSIQVEESPDEDYIRFDTAGVERMQITNTGTLNYTGAMNLDGTVTIDTDTGAQPFYVTRVGAANQSLRMEVGDAWADFYSEQDEDAGIRGGYRFYMDDDGTQTPYFALFNKSAVGSPIFLAQSDNNIGIGTNAPEGFLDVNGSATGKALVQLRETGDQDILTASNSAGTTRFRMANNGYFYGERFSDISNSNYYLDPAAAGTSMTTVSNVGIGTSAPDTRLDVVGSGGSVGATVQNTTSTGWSGVTFHDDTNTQISRIHHFNSGWSSGTSGWETNSLAIANNTAGIQLVADGASADLRFLTGGQNDRMIIQSNGNVGIGTTAASSLLEVSGNIELADTAGDTITQFIGAGSDHSGINMRVDGAANEYQWEHYTSPAIDYLVIDYAGSTGNIHIPNGVLSIGDTDAAGYAIDIDGSGDGRGIRFDDGDAFITTHDGFGNFNFLSGIDDDNVIVKNSGGSRIEMSDSGAIYHEIYTGSVGTTGSLSTTFGINGSYAYLSGANLGVGTSTPGQELEVSGDILLSGYIMRTSHQSGYLAGGYNNLGANSLYSNPIFTIGTNYAPLASSLNNMYGIGYSHTNASFITDPGVNSWGMYVAADGDARIWFGASANADSYFNTGGNIGIKTNNPDASLHIVHNEPTEYNALWINADNTSGNFGNWYATRIDADASVAGTFPIAMDVSANSSVSGYGSIGMQLSAGNAGMGWAGNTDYGLMVSAPAAGFSISSQNGKNYFEGNVGIGTLTFSSALDVWGQANLGAQDGNNVVYVRRQNSSTEGGHITIQRGGSYTSDVNMDSYGNDFRLWNGPATTTNASFFNTAAGQVMNVITDGSASDFAETVYKAEDMEGGDIVLLREANNEDGVEAIQSTASYDNRVAGIVSTAPGTTLKAPSKNPETGEVVRVTLVGKYTDDVRAMDPSLEPIALSGRVPVKVIAKPGETIDYGSAIVSSDKKGVGQKATKPGISIGRTITRFRPNTLNCTPVNSVADINWPKDPEGNNAAKPCYRLPDGSHVGKVMVMVQTAYVDPTLAVADVSTATISGDLASGYGVKLNGQAVTKQDGFLSAVIGNLRTGLINTQDLIVERTASIKDLSVESLTINGQSLADYIASVVGGQSFSGGEALVSPLGDDTIITTASDSGQIAFTNADDETVTTISESGDISTLGNLLAQEVTTTNLTASGSSTLGSLLVTNDATVAGTLTANNTSLGNLLAQEASVAGSIAVAQDASVAGTLLAGQIEAASSRIAQLEAGMAQLESVKATTAELTTATVSGTLYADNIYDFENKVTTTLKRPGILELLAGDTESTDSGNLADLYETVNATELNASSAAELDVSLADLTNTQDDVIITGTALFIEKYFKVNGAGYISDSLAVGNSLFVGDSTQITDGVIAYNTADPDNQILQIQPSGQGSIELLAGLVKLDDSGTVTVNGDFFTTGNARIEGTLLTDLIQPTDFGNPLQVQVAGIDTQSNEVKKSRFEIINEVGSPVATFSAEGDAEFTGSVKADGGIKLESQDLGSSTTNELTAEKTSGKATISSGANEVIIKSELITNDSLVYVTAVGSTNNQVLYVKAQTPENTDTPEKEGQFTVGFDRPTNTDVTFNWWVVN